MSVQPVWHQPIAAHRGRVTTPSHNTCLLPDQLLVQLMKNNQRTSEQFSTTWQKVASCTRRTQEASEGFKDLSSEGNLTEMRMMVSEERGVDLHPRAGIWSGWVGSSAPCWMIPDFSWQPVWASERGNVWSSSLIHVNKRVQHKAPSIVFTCLSLWCDKAGGTPVWWSGLLIFIYPAAEQEMDHVGKERTGWQRYVSKILTTNVCVRSLHWPNI